MSFSWGWPKQLTTGCGPLDDDAVACFASPEHVIVVFQATLQVWSGGQHRLKLGELHRPADQVEEEGANVRAHWCPQKRVLAVATAKSHLQLYNLNVSSEPLWRLPSGEEVRRVNVYLSHSIHLDYGLVRIGDVGGDAKSLLVALSNGTMQVFSWQGKLRGQANPFTAAYENSRSRLQRASSRAVSGALARASIDRLASSSMGDLGGSVHGGSQHGGGSVHGANGVAWQPSPFQSTSESGSRPTSASGGSARPSVDAEAPSALLAALGSVDMPQPTPATPSDVSVARIHYAPAARMLAVVLADGRCALCRTADSGIHPVEQVQLLRWAYKPAGPAAPAAVAAALNPSAQLLALGLSHGRVAIYTLQSLLSSRHASLPHARTSSGGLRTSSDAAAGGGGPGQPEPARMLSLADWGYRSSVVGPAAVLQWSPDGRVLAVGYAERGMAVWTPSGCRLMCSLRQAVATATPGSALAAGLGGPDAALAGAGQQQQAQQQQQGAPAARAQRSSTDSSAGLPSPGKRAASMAPGGEGLWSQTSSLNPSHAPEAGVLEGGVSALAWTAQGYQLLVAEKGQAGCLHQLEFARQVHGAHRVVQPWAAPGAEAAGPGSQAQELQVLQAADRILLISESRQAANPALRVPAGPNAQSEAEAAGARPDLVLQHVKLPQQYIDAAYPLMHAALSQDQADVAVAGTRGLAVYSRRARRWRLFGDATQERSLRVQGLIWLPGGVIAAVAHVDGNEGAGSPQLLLYPQYHLDNASLLARLPLKQVPVAMDSAGWHLLLAFHPLELKLFRVTVEGPLGPAGRPIARLSAVRELSIMGLGNPLQEVALIDPASLAGPERPSTLGSLASLGGAPQQQQQDGQQAPADGKQQVRQSQQGQQAQQAGQGSAASASWPQLSVATRPSSAGSAGAASDTPLQCVLLRAGGIMSKLDLQEGSEVLLSDAIERFWLPLSSAAAGAAQALPPSRTNSFSAGGAGGGISASSSFAGLGRQSSEAELAAAGSGAAAAVALKQQGSGAANGSVGAAGAEQGRLPPRVEMPWWTYGARGMQLWFPSSLSEPLTPSARSVASPTATGLAAAAAAAATNSTDPELEFDREVYPIGVSLAEVSIIGVMQRSVRSQAFPPEAPQSLCFHPLPESQPVLPCLLRRLLQKGRQEEALELARWHSTGPHFNRSLEWLLFTALELDAEQQPSSGPTLQHTPLGAAAGQHRFNSSYAVTLNSWSGGGGQQGQTAGVGSPRGGPGQMGKGVGGQRRAGPLLVASARLISQFPQFPEIVVSVARKTDAALWPALFAAVGSPGRLCQGLMQEDKLQSAACCLVIVEQIEGSAQAQAQALQLMGAALSGGQYSLAADLLRFLVPPGDGQDAPASARLASLSLGEAQPAGQAAEQLQQMAERGAEQQAAAAAKVAAQAKPPQQQQPAAQAGGGGGGWFWGLFGGGSTAEAAPAESPVAGQAATPSAFAAGAAQSPVPHQASARLKQQQQHGEEDGAAAAEAWRLTGQHAWKMMDAGALREAAQLARSLAELHGGLPALLAATAADFPGSHAHLHPSAAAIASALFVAANEFAAGEQDGEAAASAELLLAVCQEARCVNLATALALLLGDQPALQQFAAQHPAVWSDLHALIANDVHLCGYAPVLSPMPSPMVGGGSGAGALLAA